jgi:Flp pilus assembly protein CpaB
VRGSLAIAVVFSVLAGLFFLAAVNGRSGTQVAVAARDLRPGDPIDEGAVRYVDVSGPGAVLATLVRSGDLDALRGSVLSHPVPSGAVLSRDDLVPAAAGSQPRWMSIPVDAEHAAGGSIAVGDIVDVIDGGDTGGTPSYALTGARVVAVSRPSGGALGSGSGKSSITVALPDGPLPDGRAALAVATAIRHDKVEVVRSTGAASLPAAAALPAPASPRGSGG